MKTIGLYIFLRIIYVNCDPVIVYLYCAMLESFGALLLLNGNAQCFSVPLMLDLFYTT